MDLWIMPYYTNYNEGVTVPDVTSLPLDEAEALLETYGLRHEVLDRRAHSAYPANFIIDQTPEAKQIVKPDRKVYLIVNTDATPKTVVPKDRKSTRLNSSHVAISYAVFCLKKKRKHMSL